MVKTEEKEKTPRRSPVPQNADRILQGVLKLKLEQKVMIRNALTESIASDFAKKKSEFEQASKLVGE